MTIPDALRPRRPRHTTVLLTVGLLLLLTVVTFAIYALRAAEQAQHQALQTQSADAQAIGQLSTALNQTRQQLQQHGVVPKAPPPTTIIQGVPGAQGAQGGVGPAGPQGEPGPIGATGPAGAVGKTGAMGATGPSGAVGATGPAGVAGPAGPQGTAGPAGQPGSSGAAGQPPAGWTFTDATGATYDCERVSNFDPNQPRYTCTRTSGGPPSPNPSPAPSQSAVTNSGKHPSKPRSAAVSTGPR